MSMGCQGLTCQGLETEGGASSKGASCVSTRARRGSHGNRRDEAEPGAAAVKGPREHGALRRCDALCRGVQFTQAMTAPPCAAENNQVVCYTQVAEIGASIRLDRHPLHISMRASTGTAEWRKPGAAGAIAAGCRTGAAAASWARAAMPSIAG